jgi:hypothetical protein
MAFNLVRYSQQDPQWKDDKIGGGPDTIGYIGCALTSTAMLVSGWGYTETPATLNKKLTAIGGFIDEAIVWSKVSAIYPQIQSTGLTICQNSAAPLSQIDDSLASGQPVIVEVDYSPDAGLQTHWVLVYAKQGNDYLIQDPWPNPPETNPVTLMSRFSQGQPLQRAIKAVAWYVCTAAGTPPPSSTPDGSTTTTPSAPLPPAVETDLVVVVAASATAGLRLHTQPSADSPANFAEMPGTQLNVIEEKDAALAKIGVNNQWIYVRDPNLNQGYVAAWYVEKAPDAAPAGGSTPEPAPAPAPSNPPAPTTPPPASAPQKFQVIVSPTLAPGGLRLRKVPSMGGALVAIEQPGAALTVIEPPSSALPKIGAAGQWIAVRDDNGLRGYVAAQYVVLSQ